MEKEKNIAVPANSENKKLKRIILIISTLLLGWGLMYVDIQNTLQVCKQGFPLSFQQRCLKTIDDPNDPLYSIVNDDPNDSSSFVFVSPRPINSKSYAFILETIDFIFWIVLAYIIIKFFVWTEKKMKWYWRDSSAVIGITFFSFFLRSVCPISGSLLDLCWAGRGFPLPYYAELKFNTPVFFVDIILNILLYAIIRSLIVLIIRLYKRFGKKTVTLEQTLK
ncbi:MAG: hypothetical protein WCX27_01880 [Candidatus Paceibacterota bacterium]|jgi:hypothetical protein